MSRPACMGGWCARRDKCFYYHNTDADAPIFERLCNDDEYDAFQQVVFVTETEPELETADE